MKLVSDNDRLIRTKHGRMCLGQNYRAYKETLVNVFKIQAAGASLSGDFEFELTAATHKDISNLIKAILDSLQQAGVIENDRNAMRIVLNKIRIKRNVPEMATIKIRPINNQGVKNERHADS